jgi:hypothetical protein
MTAFLKTQKVFFKATNWQKRRSARYFTERGEFGRKRRVEKLKKWNKYMIWHFYNTFTSSLLHSPCVFNPIKNSK